MLEREVFASYCHLQRGRSQPPPATPGSIASRINRALTSGLTSGEDGELGSDLFSSFYFLQCGRYRLRQFKVGTAASLLAHAAALMVTFPLPFLYIVGGNGIIAGSAYGGGRSFNQIVQVQRPTVIFPSPQVVRHLLGKTPESAPVLAAVVGVKDSIARGEANPNPSGSSQLPKSGQGDGQLSGADEAGSGPGGDGSGSTGTGSGEPDSIRTSPSPDRSGRLSEPTRTKTPREIAPAESPATGPRREVVVDTHRLPTMATPPRPSSPEESGNRGANLPPVGGAPNLTALNSDGSDFGNSQSSIVNQGPIDLTKKGVGVVEIYRLYLEEIIERHWQIPPEANLLEQSVSLRVEFEIAKDGRLLSARLYNSTGIRALDRAAIRAIELASPFRPLPSVFATPRQLFTDTFWYHPPQSN